MTPILSIKNLTVEFDSKIHKSKTMNKNLWKGEKNSKNDNFIAVNGVNLEVFPDEFVALVGESGSGKSMTSLSVMNLLPENAVISSGKIEFNGKNKSIIFQEPMTSLNPLIKVGKQIAESGILNGMTKTEAQKKAEKLAKMMGLEDIERIFNSYPHALSGGMRQRIMIASALMTNPELLIADEPTTALDVSTQNEILKIIKILNEKFGTSLLLITHDFGVVKKMCSRVYIMYRGKIVEQGATSEIFANPKHPYTKALLSAIPSWSKKGQELPNYFEQDFVDLES